MIYSYECPKGHLTDVVLGMNEAKPGAVRCSRSRCKLSARRIYTVPAVKPDVPEHFNSCLQEHVRSGSHLRDLQKERGVGDFEEYADADTKAELKESRAKVMKDGGRT